MDLVVPSADAWRGAAGAEISGSGSIVGTPAYMPPEQARGEDVDERADVYSLGAILYELLAGGAPYSDVSAPSVLELLIAGPPTALVRRAPRMPRELADIVAKAMAREPRDRYPSARAFADDLRRYQTGKLVSAHAYPVWHLARKKLAQYPRAAQLVLAGVLVVSVLGVQSLRSTGGEPEICNSGLPPVAPQLTTTTPPLPVLRANLPAHAPCQSRYVTVAGSQTGADAVNGS
jgi:serine/threonine protein kinase